MRYVCTAALVSALAIFSPRVSSAQTRDRGSVDFVSGMSLGQGTGLTDALTSNMNLGGRVALNILPGFQVVGEFGRIGNVLPPLTQSIIGLSPYAVRASALYGEGGVRLLATPRSAVSPYVESTMGFAHLNLGVGGLGATQSDILNLGLGLVNRTSPMAGLGGGVMMHAGRMTFDVGYRYKKIFAKDLVGTLLGGGNGFKSQQLAFGVGVRF